MNFIGIIIRQPKKSVFNPVPTYENQLINTVGALIQDSQGQSIVDVPHNKGNSVPLTLSGTIDSNNRVHGLKPTPIDNNFGYISTKSFFRIFENTNKL